MLVLGLGCQCSSPSYRVLPSSHSTRKHITRWQCWRRYQTLCRLITFHNSILVNISSCSNLDYSLWTSQPLQIRAPTALGSRVTRHQNRINFKSYSPLILGLKSSRYPFFSRHDLAVTNIGLALTSSQPSFTTGSSSSFSHYLFTLFVWKRVFKSDKT